VKLKIKNEKLKMGSGTLKNKHRSAFAKLRRDKTLNIE
jgi:hypothetical protein